MSLKKILGKIFLCLVLQVGVLAGVKMTPEEIEKLMRLHNETRVVQVQKKGDPDR